LLVEHGYEVVGLSMQLWKRRAAPSVHPLGKAAITSGSCCSLEDLYDARRVASRLAIPFYVVNFQQEFESTVVRPFVRSYLNGETPSPCVLCNTHLKFDRLLRFSRQVDADLVATGHYARIQFDSSTKRYQLLKSKDPAKDQSYFLFELRQEQLARALFPLGELTKEQVREKARSMGLSVAQKADSQEICFVEGKRYADFIDNYRNQLSAAGEISVSGSKCGEIVNEDGKVLGTHRGIHHYTIGQRRGLGIAAPFPYYVVRIDPIRNQIIVGSEEQLSSRDLTASSVNWIAMESLLEPTRATVKVRSRAAEAPATLHSSADGRVRVEFDEPIRAITPGQAAVFYEKDCVLGGGWIDRK
jgi:tRNA-specific 2-thiouridylase